MCFNPQQEQINKERLIFISLCSDDDRKRINGKMSMQLRDFERLCYLLDSLGLNYFLAELERNHPKLLRLLKEEDLDMKIRTHKRSQSWQDMMAQWFEVFCEQLPSPTMKPYFEQIFKEDYPYVFQKSKNE